MRSQSITRTEASEKFKKIGSNVCNLSYRHKKVEVGLECLETAVALQLNTLFCCFAFHHNRLERLEAANERQLEIQTKHLQLTLDPTTAQRNGTFDSLKQLLTQEIQNVRQGKDLLEKDRASVFESTHEEDQDFLERKHKASKLYDYFHAKIDKNNDASDFDIAQISDVSDDKTIESQESHTNQIDSRMTPKQETPDEAMPDATDCDFLETTPESLNPDFQQGEFGTILPDNVPKNPPVLKTTKQEPPLSWDSDADEDVETQQTQPEPQWTTTPSRSKSTGEAIDTLQQTSASSRSSKARNLFKQAFPSWTQENRFSPLEDDLHTDNLDPTMNSTEINAGNTTQR